MDLSQVSVSELQEKLKGYSPADVAKMFAQQGVTLDPKMPVPQQCEVAHAQLCKPATAKPSAPLAGSLPVAPVTPSSPAEGAVSNPLVIPAYFVRSRQPKRRRAGRTWTSALVRVLETEFSAEQWAELRADKVIEIREIK